MNSDKRMSSLETALRHLADETAGARPPARIETALRAAVRRRRMVRYPWWMAAAALVCVGFWAARQDGPDVKVEQSMAPVSGPPRLAEPSAAVEDHVEAIPVAKPAVVRSLPAVRRNEPAKQLSPLTPWYYSDGLPEPARGQIVFIRVNSQTARRFGVVSDGPVAAQLWIGDDGLTRAIRFVRE